MNRLFLASAFAAALACSSQAIATPAPQGARVYFINLKDGQHVKSPVLVQFGLTGMGVAPAGTIMEGTGHHHLIIDAPTPAAGVPIPMDANHVHFGKGQTEVSATLTPGTHTLQLVLADAAHIPHEPAVVSEKITITVDP